MLLCTFATVVMRSGIYRLCGLWRGVAKGLAFRLRHALMVVAWGSFLCAAAQLSSATPQVGGPIVDSPDGRDFLTGSVKVATAPWLTATQGQIDVECQMPTNWPSPDDTVLFHAQSQPHVHATLCFRGGVLWAVYKGGEAFFASATLPETARWAAGSWHRIQFGWRPAVDDDGEAISNNVQFTLIADKRSVAGDYGRVMTPWPTLCELGGRNGTVRWRGKVRRVSFSSEPLLLSEALPEMKPGERTITVQSDRPIGPCYRFWTVANCNAPHHFLKPEYAAGISNAQPFVRQVNTGYLLGGRYPDRNVWYRGVSTNGEMQVNFSGMIAQLRAMLDGGLTPWILLDNVPYAMCHTPQENTYGNTAPPDDEQLWRRYVEAAVRAMVDAFGRERVSRWWFCVWSEPDLVPGHWAGTREQYFEHCDYTVAAVTHVLPEARISLGNILNPIDGQFGTKTQGMWGLDIIDHAACGTNAVTGGIGTRLDWFSCSWYARVGRPLSDFDDAVNLMRTRLSRYPQFRDTSLAIGEFAVLHDENGRRLWCGDTSEWAASFYAGLADRVYRYGIQQVYEWAQTTEGIFHPRTQVIAMLDCMADGRRVETDVQASSDADCGAVSCRKGDDLFILLYNHRALRRPSVSEKVHLVVCDNRMRRNKTWTFSESLVDAEHATWAYDFAADCRAEGVKPLPQAGRYEGGVSLLYGSPGVIVFRKNKEKYRRLSQMVEKSETIHAGVGRFERDIDMAGHSVRLIKFSPEAGNEKSHSFAWGLFDFMFHSR